MAKKPNLRDALGSLSSRSNLAARIPEPTEPSPEVPDARPEPATSKAPARSAPGRTTGAARAPSRIGRRMIAGHFEPEVSQQLRILCAQHDRSVQEMLREALNDLFQKYGQPPIA